MLEALAGLVDALDANDELVRAIRERAQVIRADRAEGRTYATIATAEERPLIVEMLRTMQDRLAKAGSRFRREEARALRAEGLTFDQIAAVFGVTRQRVIALVADAPPPASR